MTLPEPVKCFAVVAGLASAWAFVVCRVLVGVSPEYAAHPTGAGLTRVTAYLAAGFVVGLMTTAAARLGNRLRRPALSLVAPTMLTLAVTTALIVAAAIGGAVLHAQQAVALPAELLEQVPARRQGAFVAALGGHLALGTLFPVAGVQAGAVWLSRRGRRRLSISGHTQSTEVKR